MENSSSRSLINNAFYDDLGERWYTADDDPIALLRAEGALKNPWVVEKLKACLGEGKARILDIGCGGGFLAHALGNAGFKAVGVDLSEESLEVARRRGGEGRVSFQKADAYHLPFGEAEFDGVCTMDFLEHVDRPGQVIAEAARVLKSGGPFFFHTFNRNPLSGIFAIYGVRWFVRNTPKNFHVYPLFIRPEELKGLLNESGFELMEMVGLRPKFSGAFFKLLLTRRVPKDFQFVFTPSTRIGYMGWARKR